MSQLPPDLLKRVEKALSLVHEGARRRARWSHMDQQFDKRPEQLCSQCRPPTMSPPTRSPGDRRRWFLCRACLKRFTTYLPAEQK